MLQASPKRIVAIALARRFVVKSAAATAAREHVWTLRVLLQA